MIDLDKLISACDAEILATAKDVKGLRINNLIKEGDVYRTFSKDKIADGEYLLASAAVKEQAVTVERNDEGMVFVSGIDSDFQIIYSATLQKDNSALLKATVEGLKGIKADTKIINDPYFIVGPPGTGKTTVITQIITEALKKKQRVLIVSQTNMAVENVYEKIDFAELDLEVGDVILAIKTDKDSLLEFSPASIAKTKLRPVQDELELLEYALGEILNAKKEAEATLSLSLDKEENLSLSMSSCTHEISLHENALKKATSELKEQEHRMSLLNSNSFIKSVASSFMGVKITEIEAQIAIAKKVIETTEIKKAELDKKKKILNSEKNDFDKSLTDAEERMKEVAESKKQVESRIAELKKQIAEIKGLDLFRKAKLVGATLMSAALNKRINDAEFDVIIVDEASMAPLPVLTLACKAVKIKSEKKPEVVWSILYDKLYPAQNEAVNEALKSQFIFVGDPKQLSPISKTAELKRTVFDSYGVEKIINGEKIKHAALLNINHRNHPDIVELTSNLFYGGLLKSGKKHDGKKSLFIRKTSGMCVRDGSSYVNHTNAVAIQERILDALKKGRRKIGAITPFNKQAENINSRLEAIRGEYTDSELLAGTVHKFQGQEKSVILFDVTISSGSPIPVAFTGDMFSETARLLNVAMTRAEDFFVLIGDIDGLEKQLSFIPNHESFALWQWIVGIKELAYRQ